MGEADLLAAKALSGVAIAPDEHPHVFRFVNLVYSLAKELGSQDSLGDIKATEPPPVVFPAHTYLGGTPVSSSLILPHMSAASQALSSQKVGANEEKEGKAEQPKGKSLASALPAVNKTAPAFRPQAGHLEHGTSLVYAML